VNRTIHTNCHSSKATTNHESPRLRPALRGFASEIGSNSASLRNNLEGKLISPPKLPIRRPNQGYFMSTTFIGRLPNTHISEEGLSE